MKISLSKKTILIALLLIGHSSTKAEIISFQIDPKKIEALEQSTDTLIQYIENIKNIVEYIALDKHQVLDEYFIKQKEGVILKSKIEYYKEFILSNFSEIIKQKELNQLLPTEVKNKKQFYSWEDENFGTHFKGTSACHINSDTILDKKYQGQDN